jgi:UDP-N-acetylmuramoylalanine--D-glutamate ligase
MKDVVIIGLGETGFSCVEYFQANHTAVTIIDSREKPPRLADFKAKYPSVSIVTGGFPKEILQKTKLVVLSPGVPKDHPDIVNAIAKDTEVIGDIELFARQVAASVVAITGSNGKSTVTTLVGEMAKNILNKVGVGGNLGTPALSLLSVETELYVLELSSFQLETTHSLHPKVATILNLSVDHLDRYASFGDYRAAKLGIYDNCEQIVFNRQDPILPDLGSKKSQSPLVSFGLDMPEPGHFGLVYDTEWWLAKGKERLIPAKKLQILGKHNLANALAALALGEGAGLPMESMLTTLENFKGLAHRCEWVCEKKDIQWVNDSKGTNVGATVAALEGLGAEISNKWVLIAGGIGKNADFRPLMPLVAKYCRALVLMGEARDELFHLFHPMLPCFPVKDMEEAVVKAAALAEPGDGVLLSPACSSLDMFRNFEERGMVFKAWVKMLPSK